MAIRKNLSTPEWRDLWGRAAKASEEVAKWPEWKGGPRKPMKINGYKLREAIKAWETRKELAEQALNNALFVFPGDDATYLENNPVMYWEQLAEAEQSIVRLQTAQAQYNLKVSVQVGEQHIRLAYAIKYIGAIQRFVKLELRARIATANAEEVELEGLDENLFPPE